MERKGWTRTEFKSIYECHVGEVFRAVSRRVGPAVAEEVTAEAFLQAWATRERYCPELGTELSWLRGIAFNILRHHYRGELRKQRAYLRAGAEVPSTEPGFDEDRRSSRSTRLRRGSTPSRA